MELKDLPIGTKIKIINATSGSFGANGKEGFITNGIGLDNHGLGPSENVVHVKTSETSMWTIGNDSKIEVLEKPQPKEEIRIFKSHRSNKINALLYEDGKVVKSAVAKCHADDKFDFETGAKIALDRLFLPKKEEMFGFCIGDRVKSSDEKAVGKVIGFSSDMYGYILVEFDFERIYFHDGNNNEIKQRKGKPHHCYYCSIKELEKLN